MWSWSKCMDDSCYFVRNLKKSVVFFTFLNSWIILVHGSRKQFFICYSKVWLTFTYLNSWILLVQFSRKQFLCGTHKSCAFLTFLSFESYWSIAQESDFNVALKNLTHFYLLESLESYWSNAQESNFCVALINLAHFHLFELLNPIGPFSIFEESSEEPLKLSCITLRYEKMSTNGVTVEESSECSENMSIPFRVYCTSLLHWPTSICRGTVNIPAFHLKTQVIFNFSKMFWPLSFGAGGYQ